MYFEMSKTVAMYIKYSYEFPLRFCRRDGNKDTHGIIIFDYTIDLLWGMG